MHCKIWKYKQMPSGACSKIFESGLESTWCGGAVGMLHGKSGHFFSSLKCVLTTNQLWVSIYGSSYANMVFAYKSPNKFSTKMNSVLEKLSTLHVTMNVYSQFFNF